MKVFLAGTASNNEITNKNKPKYILESFYYIRDWQIPYIKTCKMFLLDSGAFTFMNNFKGKVNWKNYIDKYIKFINDYDIKYFFELDIDVIVGYENVKKIRRYIEIKTNKKCIPVWHKSRGLKEWVKLTKEYDYVAIGGFVIKEIKKTDYKFVPKLLEIAHKNKCKVHGLGFTSMSYLSKIHFFSVDSTSWLSGGRFGQLCKFENGNITTVTNKSKRGISKKLDDNNLKQWVKFQEYADKHL